MSEGTALTNYDEAFAKAAMFQAENTRATGGATFISTRGGVLSFGEEQLPGNQMCVIILDNVHENTYYEGKFDPEQAQAPKCYAFGRGKGDDMEPHVSMAEHPDYFVPQSESCTGCPHDVWGSADTGRGKACQNRERLALIPAGQYSSKKGSRDFDLDIFEDPKHYKDAEVVFLKLPTTSVSEFAKYLGQIRAAHRRPSWGVLTRVYLEPHPKHQYHVRFEMIELLSNDLAPVVMDRQAEASESIVTGYTPPQERDEAPARGVRGLRR